MSFRRTDSRTELDLRPLTISLSLLSRADGSCQFSFGDLKVLGAMTGPAEVKIRDERPKEATVEVNVLPLASVPGPSTKSVGQSIRAFLSPLLHLDLYPRSLIQINLQTLSKPSERWSSFSSEESRIGFGEGESVAERATLMNAASVALVDGGVGMCGVGVSVAVAVLRQRLVKRIDLEEDDEQEGWVALLDPSPREEAEALSVHLVGYRFGGETEQASAPILDQVQKSHGEMCFCESYGRFDQIQLNHVFKLSHPAAVQIFTFIRTSFEHQYLKPLSRPATSSIPLAPHPIPDSVSSVTRDQNHGTKQKKKKTTK
ncbi:hypothetical protein CROQUDRAFT_669117 [Cronartium quercuum f. sp. fusiforme G11]|uniref:Exoribonuclease phosphorolytic domain-containing protein n=1 Tax=Cronartium quercuum f. sp. fusiforme G11 TaxID=708437 RepID=A0A9P6NU60_9BASI|nr:hypothetical protein CROQUDRAFT_669117 [Cronartium quercuum f. sp. fusiforme G11]